MAVVDTFVWQALASVAIPGFTINRVCAASLYILSTATRWPLAVRKWTTTTLGLLAIPVIIHPIDRWVRPPAPGVAHCTGRAELWEGWSVTPAAEAALLLRLLRWKGRSGPWSYDLAGTSAVKVGGAMRVGDTGQVSSQKENSENNQR